MKTDTEVLEARRVALRKIIETGSRDTMYITAIKQGYIDTLHALVKQHNLSIERMLIMDKV